MRCEECLAVIEEYFDGELERRQSERVGAHAAACEDCAAALDALSDEHELYLRYDRGIEVSPALWQNVRAGVARLEDAREVSKPLPPPAGLRGRVASAFKLFAPRAAFAPALALVVIAAFVGALWLARRDDSAPEVAQDRPAVADEGRAPITTAPDAPAIVDGGRGVGTPAPAPTGDRRPVENVEVAFVNAGLKSPAAVRSPRPDRDALTPPPAENHLTASEVEQLLDTRPAPPDATDVVFAATAAHVLTPEEKEMARHLEQAQTLLRSFQNEAGAEGDAVQIAYERRLSRKLLADNASLQLEAEASGNKETRQVLDTLEPFLLDIANLRDNASRDEVRSIKERMQKKEIIAALHVY